MKVRRRGIMAKNRRISGTGMNRPAAYAVRADDGTWAMDVGAVSARIAAYLDEAAEAGKYSVAGLCIALDITREMYALWRAGYVCAADAQDDLTDSNIALCECMAMGELHLQRYWEESDKSTTLHMKMLESTGVIGHHAPERMRPPFDLGALKKYAR
jgi:hypothetical protein